MTKKCTHAPRRSLLSHSTTCMHAHTHAHPPACNLPHMHTPPTCLLMLHLSLIHDAATLLIHDAATSLIHDAATSLIQGNNCTLLSSKVKSGDISFTGKDINQLNAELHGVGENVSLADFQEVWKNNASYATNRADMQKYWDSIPALVFP